MFERDGDALRVIPGPQRGSGGENVRPLIVGTFNAPGMEVALVHDSNLFYSADYGIVEIGSSKLSTMYAIPDRLGVEGFTYLLILAPSVDAARTILSRYEKDDRRA